MVNGYVDPGFVDAGFVGDSASVGLPYTAPTKHSTDFREYRRGRHPEDWTLQYAVEGLKNIDFLVDGAYYDLPHRSMLQIVPSASADRALSFNRPNGDAGIADQEVLVCQRLRSRTSAAETSLRVLLRGSGALGAASYYLFTASVTGGATLGIYKSIAGVLTTLATTAKAYKDGAWIWMRARASGASLFLRTWQDGDAEPGAWDITATGQTDLATGWCGLHARNTGHKTDVRYFAVGTGGSSAPLELEIEPPFDTWASQEDVEVNLSAKIEYYNPTTDAVESRWVSMVGFKGGTGPADYPANTPIPPLLLDPGGYVSRLEADVQFSGAALPSPQQMRFDNRPTKQGGRGPWDDFVGYSIAGRPIEIRIGKVWKVKPSPTNPDGIRMPHYRYEMVGCALAEQEMIVGPEDAVVQLGPADTNLKAKLPVRRNVGISTGFKPISLSGWLSIPSSAVYNGSQFIISVRAYIPTAGLTGSGSGISALSRRQIDATHRQWSIIIYNATHATLPNQLHFISDKADGTPLISFIPPMQYNLGRFLDIVFGIRGGVEWFAAVDGDIIGEGLISANPVSASSAIVEVGRSAMQSIICDHRIDKYTDPSEALSNFSNRRDPDRNNLSMHRCDDGGGATVTDYNTTVANHGTLQGTDGVDRAWSPTYLGSVELTGSPMPISGGVVFNIPTQPVDSVRECFRYNDRDETQGVSVKVRAKGLVLTGGGVSYSEPVEGPGVVDIVGASDQPITIGLAPAAGVENSRIHVPRLLRDELIDRGALSEANCDRDSFDGLRKILPVKGGFYFAEAPVVGDFLGNTLRNIACHYTIDRDGRASVGCVLPTVNPGPYGQESLLEWTGLPECGVTLSDHADYRLTQVVKDFGIVCWFKFTRKILSDRSVSTSGDYSQPGYTLIDKMDGTTSGYYLGFDGDTGALRFAAGGLTFGGGANHYFTLGDYTVWPTNEWCAVNLAIGAGTSFAYMQVSTMDEKFVFGLSTSVAGALADSSGIPLRIGYGPMGSFVGSIAYVIGSSPSQVPHDVLEIGENNNPLLNSGGPGGDSRWVPRYRLYMNDGKGETANESVLNRPAYIHGARWCPRAKFNYTIHPDLNGAKSMDKAWRVDTRYGINNERLIGANVAASVSASDRIALGEDYLSTHLTNRAISRGYNNSADLIFNTPLITQEESDLIKFLILRRIEGKKRGGDILNWTKEAFKLTLGDEVLLLNDRWIDGGPMRVAGLVAALGQLKGDVGLWGADDND